MKGTNSRKCMSDGGEMGELMRSIDWSSTVLSDPASWPQVLRTTLRFILDTPFPMYIAWGDKYTQLYNDGYRPILGTTKHPYAMGNSSKETFAEIWDTIGPLFASVKEGNSVRRTDLLLVLDRNGYPEECYFDFSYSPIRLDDASVGGILVTVVETTEKVKLLKTLKQRQKNYLDLLAQAPVAMCVLKGPEHVVEIASEKMIQLWGKTSEQVMNKPIFEGLPEAKKQGLEELLDTVYQTGERFVALEHPVNLPRENSIETVYQNFVYEPFFNSDGAIGGVIAVTQEVTEQVKARQIVEEAEERIRMAAEAGNLGTFDYDVVTKKTVLSDRFYEIFEADRNATKEEIIHPIHPDDKAIREEAMKAALAHGNISYEVRLIKKDGGLKWVRIAGKILFDENKKPRRMLGTALDITETKELDQKREEYIAIASHELRNPLTSLKLSLDMLSLDGDGPQRELFLSKSKYHLNRVINLSDDLLNVSKIAAGVLDLNSEIFNLKDCIEESVATFQAGIEKNPINICGPSDINIKGDKFRIEQVLVNLISNASKYSPNKSPVSIQVIQEPNTIKIEVHDKGIGIDQEKLPHVFKKFTRLEGAETVIGYGLGLYISEQIVRKHGGKIGVESEKGKGSIFWFSIPY